jgi:hypothetical protein
MSLLTSRQQASGNPASIFTYSKTIASLFNEQVKKIPAKHLNIDPFTILSHIATYLISNTIGILLNH